MSHLITTYGLQIGAKIDKPSIVKTFFPVPCDNYITIHNSSGMGAKNYDYMQDVVDDLLPIVTAQNLSIVQIGGKDDAALDGCIHLQGKTSYNQTAFIISNSKLHFGNDSFPVHLASMYDIPIVALYSISSPEICGPFFSSKEKVILLSPDMGDKKRSFNPNENPKTVNTIQVENIVSSILKLLNIKNKIEKESVFIGKRYKDRVIEFVPDQVLRKEFAADMVLNMRVDLVKGKVDESAVLLNLKNRKFSLCMSNEKNVSRIDILSQFKENIVEIFFDITDGEVNYKYIKSLCSAGIRPIIIYKGEDDKKLNAAKLQLMELSVHFIVKNKNKEEIDKLQKLADIKANIALKTNRIILSDNKVYLTEAHFLADSPTSEKEDRKINVDKDKLFNEAEFLYFYTIK